MFQLNSRSPGKRPAAASFSPPPDVTIVNDEECSSGPSEDGCPSEEDSYGVSNDVSKQGKKGHQPQRSVVDRLRLCFLTGRLSRALLQGTILLSVGAASFTAFQKIPFLLQQSRNVDLKAKPMMMAMYFADVSSRSYMGKVERLRPASNKREWMKMMEKRLQHRHKQKHHHHHNEDSIIPVDPLSKRLDSIDEDSSYYEDEKPELTPNPEQCTPQYEWQTASYPACNTVHENTMMADRMFLLPPTFEQENNPHHHHRHRHSHSNNQLRSRRLLEKAVRSSIPELKQQYRMLANGYWRDTWRWQTETEPIAFKTMRFHHEITEYLIDKQRRDAVTSDRLTFSKQAIRMYGYCGTSALYEYAPGGDLKDLVKGFDSAADFTRYYSIQDRLILAYNVTSALADLHTTEGVGSPPAIVHGDFKADQFVAVTPVVKDPNRPHKLPHFKLGDFNLARFVYWNEKYNHPCVVKPDGNGGKNRAPEEYAQENGRTEKLDIYSLGNVLYLFLTGHFPFDDLQKGYGTKEAKELIQNGRRPHVNIDRNVRHSKDPLEQALLAAVDMCWEHDPHDRPSARAVEALLAQHIPKEFVRHHRRAVDLRRHLQ